MREEVSLKLGIAEIIFQIDAFIHAQTPVLFHIIEEVSPKVRMIPKSISLDSSI
jgi:hypothetical protein